MGQVYFYSSKYKYLNFSTSTVAVAGNYFSASTQQMYLSILKGAVHEFMGDFDVLHLVFCLAYMHKSAFID